MFIADPRVIPEVRQGAVHRPQQDVSLRGKHPVALAWKDTSVLFCPSPLMSCGSLGNLSASCALAVTLFYREAEAMNSEDRLLESHSRRIGVRLCGCSIKMVCKCLPHRQDKALFLHSCDGDR